MKPYFSTFITGAAPLIESAIKNRPKEKIIIEEILDGLILYYSSYEEKDIRRIRFFNNSFLLLEKIEADNTSGLEKIFGKLQLSEDFLKKVCKALKPQTHFRIVPSVENQIIKVNRSSLKDLESRLIERCNLKLNVKRPQAEIWIISRSEGLILVGLRLTSTKKKESEISKGELRPELANILSIASKPKPDDVILDMFAGHGSIPLERAVAYPYKKIIAVEKNKELVRKIKSKSKSIKKYIEVLEDDALILDKVPNKSVSKVIADPPWGVYEKTSIPLRGFYRKMVVKIEEKLIIGGLAVILTGAKEEMDEIVNENILSLVERYDILVSGKKAAIYVLKNS